MRDLGLLTMGDCFCASLIVPTHNRHREVAGLLHALREQSRTDFELILIDDASAVPLSSEITIEDYPFRVVVHRVVRNRGPGHCRNAGVMLSQSDVLLFTDDDCRPQPDWVDRLVTAISDAGAEIGGVGGKTVAEGGDLYSRYYEFHRILDPLPHDKNNPSLLPYLVTANCAMRKDALLGAGGFDCRIPNAGGEDVAASIRMLKAGHKLIRCADAVVRHRFRSGLKDFWRTFYRYGLGGRYVVDRYLPLEKTDGLD